MTSSVLRTGWQINQSGIHTHICVEVHAVYWACSQDVRQWGSLRAAPYRGSAKTMPEFPAQLLAPFIPQTCLCNMILKEIFVCVYVCVYIWCLCTCVCGMYDLYVCVCMFISECWDTCHGTCGRQKTALSVSPHLLSCLGQGLLSTPVHAWLAAPRASRDSPVSYLFSPQRNTDV